MKKLICLILFTLVPLAAHAADDTFIAGVYVDVTASDTTAAKQSAMNEANKKGLATVVNRITDDAAVQKFESLSSEQVINFIREVNVIDEKSSATRYMASLKVKVNEDLLRIYMKEQGMPFIKDSPHDVLIIPIMRRASHTEPMLFTDDNLWLQAWNSRTIKDGLVTFHALKTDHNLNARDILALNAGTLDRIIRENEISDIHIAEAYPDQDFFTVNMTSYLTGLRGSFQIDMTDNPAYIDQAIAKSVARVVDFVKRQRVRQVHATEKIVVLYNYPALKDWIAVESFLRKSDYVSNMTVDAFGNGKVQFKVEYAGTLEGLQRHLQRNGFRLRENQNNSYILEKINQYPL